MREKGQTEVAKTLETPVFSRGIEILTEKCKFIKVKQCEKILRLWLRELFVSGFVTDRAGKRVQTRHTFSL